MYALMYTPAIERSSPVCLLSNTAVLVATHSYATSLERRHPISLTRKQTTQNRHLWPQIIVDSDLDGLGKNLWIRLRIRNL